VTIEQNGYYSQEWRVVEHTGTHVDAPGHFTPGGRLAPELRMDELVTPAVVRWPLRPGIGDLGWGGAAVHHAIGLTARTGTPSPLRSQTRQAARQQRDLAVRASSGRAR